MSEFREMRRKDRQMPDEETMELLKSGKWGVLGLQGDDGYPYTVPINYAFSDGALYMHAAGEGYKLDCIRRNPKVSFTVIGREEMIPEKFTTHYASVTLFGHAELLESNEDKYQAIRAFSVLLAGKEKGECIENTRLGKMNMAIIKITPEHVTGKTTGI